MKSELNEIHVRSSFDSVKLHFKFFNLHSKNKIPEKTHKKYKIWKTKEKIIKVKNLQKYIIKYRYGNDLYNFFFK